MHSNKNEGDRKHEGPEGTMTLENSASTQHKWLLSELIGYACEKKIMGKRKRKKNAIIRRTKYTEKARTGLRKA